MNVPVMIGVMVLATFSVRGISLWLFSGRQLSPLLMRALSMVPVAILCAICGPLVFRPTGEWENPLVLVEFWAAAGCVLVARHGMVPAIVTGIGIYSVGKLLQ